MASQKPILLLLFIAISVAARGIDLKFTTTSSKLTRPMKAQLAKLADENKLTDTTCEILIIATKSKIAGLPFKRQRKIADYLVNTYHANRDRLIFISSDRGEPDMVQCHIDCNPQIRNRR